ncbi:MAG TPA: ATP-binding protein [Dehalococcoidia bacterium]|nr:ATP-binding protein [Dehalococcoidia bacterium]
MNAVGRVIGTEDAHPLEFWVGIGPDQYLQLDDVVAVVTELPDGTQVRHYGVVDLVRSRFEGAQYDSDVFRVADGILPADVASAAHVSVTRVEPEIFVPPTPGLPVVRASGADREAALYFDGMPRRFIAGLSRDGQPVYGNLEFLDGSRGAHVNISGVSGVATKTSYALFLLFSLFHSDALGPRRSNTRAIVFNVKGEDLLWLDKPNRNLSRDERQRYEALGLPAEPFASVGLWAPVRRDAPEAAPDTGSRQADVTPFYWTLREFCEQRLLRFLFAEADTEASQIAFAVMQVERALELAASATPPDAGYVQIEDARFTRFADLAEFIAVNQDMFTKNIAQATYNAFARRLEAAVATCGHLIRAEPQEIADRHRIDWRERQVNVIDLHNLHDRAKRFVVGVVVKRLMEEKERTGTAEPLVFLVLDELNKYAPREGWSPIKEVVLDIAERGRSMGVVLIGAQQTASEIERRVVANASFRVVGRLDAAEAQRGEYGFLTQAARARSAVLKPGSMFLLQPEIPVPLLVQFPFPCWATRRSEVDERRPDTARIFG